MKLYVDSTQARLDELEKNSDSSQIENMKKEMEVILKIFNGLIDLSNLERKIIA